MRQSVVQLENFYASRLGGAARAMADRRLRTLWPDMHGYDVLGFGFCGPYLQPYLSDAKKIALAMPGGQGAVAQTSKRGVIACLTHEDLLPFSDATFDRVLVAHGVEETPDLARLLGELWRVTRPEGRIVIIASNRSGLWARSDVSPFGAGRPFSRTQLRKTLREFGFVPTIWSGALYVPPVKVLSGPRMRQVFERFGETVWPSFSGLVLVEAVKRLYAEPESLVKTRATYTKFGTTAIGTNSVGTDIKMDGGQTPILTHDG